MDAARLLELENKFILLKEHQVPFEQIANLLPSVDIQTLTLFENNYQKMVEKLKKEGLEHAVITHRNSEGYFHRTQLFAPINQLQNIILLMKMAKFDDAKIEKIKLKHLEVFNKYCTNINIKFDEKQNGLLAEIGTISDKPLITKKVHDAYGFYVKYLGQTSIFETSKFLIEQPSSIICSSFEKILPYALKQVKVQDFQDIKSLEIANLNTDAKWIFFTGENSFGKTTILQAIALALTGEQFLDFRKQNFAIEIQNQLSSIILNYWDRQPFMLNPFKHLACYGASRLMLQTERSQNIEGAKSTTTYSLFNNDGLLLNIEYDLFKWFYKKDPRFETVIAIFKKLIPNIQDIVLDEKDDTIYYIEKNGIKRLTFNQLGSGYRSLIGMVGDMMIRLFKTQPEVTKPSDLAGIVLIDELDLHWHPKWQRRLPTLLSEIFPKVQFIASTHSEIPLLGAPENSIFLKVTRTLEEGVKVHKIDIDLSNLLPNHLLTSALFDMDFNDITAVTHKHTQNLRTEDTMQEIKKTDDVEAYLKDYATNNAKFSDDLFD